MIDIILILVLACIAAAILLYLFRAKKRGEHCVGCPYAKECAKKNAAQSKCSGGEYTKK